MPRHRILVAFVPLIMLGTAGFSSSANEFDQESAWTAQWGGFTDIQDIEVLSATDIWAVGSHTVHFDGHAWRAVGDNEQSLGLHGLDLWSSDSGWAVGWQTIMRFNSGTWSKEMTLPEINLQDVALLSESKGWAVGELRRPGERIRGVVYRLEGEHWFEVDIPFTESLVGIWMASEDEGWAVGQQGAMLQFDSGAWKSLSTLTLDDLHAVTGTGSDDVWAVGGSGLENDEIHRTILHFDGGSWTIVLSEPGDPIFDIVKRADEMWAVGYRGSRLRNIDGRWVEMGRIDGKFSDAYFGFQCAAFLPGLGGVLAATDLGRITLLQGDGYEDTHGGYFVDSKYSGLAMVSSTDGWAVGFTRTPLRFDGGRWNRVSGAGLESMADVDGVAPNDVWAVGAFGRITHYNGLSWSVVSSPTDIHLTSVAISSPGTGWSVGSMTTNERDRPIRGVILRLRDGAWTVHRELGLGFSDVDGVGTDQVWAITSKESWMFDGHDIRKWDQGGRAIDMVSPTLGWIGDEGRIYRFDGEQWQLEYVLPSGWNTPVNDLQMNSDGTGWAIGLYGMVLYRDGQAWHVLRGARLAQPSDGRPYLAGIEVITVGDEAQIWASGYQDTIIHGRQQLMAPPLATLPPATVAPSPVTPTDPTIESGRLWLPVVLTTR